MYLSILLLITVHEIKILYFDFLSLYYIKWKTSWSNSFYRISLIAIQNGKQFCSEKLQKNVGVEFRRGTGFVYVFFSHDSWSFINVGWLMDSTNID